MSITIINDCRDGNAIGRQVARAQALIGGNVNFIGVSNDLEAAGNLVDVLDALENNPGVILANVAPRNGKARRWKNGTPFCYFWFKKILVISSIDGFTLSLVKKLQLIDSVDILDIPSALKEVSKNYKTISALKDYIAESQFRSFDFLPRIAALLIKHKVVRSSTLSIGEIPDAPLVVWWIDNFGNCKTTVLEEEITITSNKLVKTQFGVLPYYKRLKDVPDKTTAIVTGSSGISNKRFVEIVNQGGNTAEKLNISSLDLIF